MAIRTTAIAVQKLLDGGEDYDGEADLDPYIETASSVVDDLLTCADEKEVTLSLSKLELIERWLSAHFFMCSNQQESETTTEKGKSKYQGQTGMYFEGTKYGQTAVMLDSSGCLLALTQAAESETETPALGIEWLGKVPSEQTPYWDRT